MIKHYLKTNYLSIVLYAALGMALADQHIGVLSNFSGFMLILVLVLAIDVNSAYVMWRSITEEDK